MRTNIWTSGLVALALAVSAPTFTSGATDDPATVRDVQRLQQEIDNLDEELAALEETDTAAARRLRDRADQVRDDTSYLRTKMRRHQDDGGRGTGVTVAEVDRLRRDVRRLRADIDSVSPVDTRRGDLRLPEGTELTVRLEEPLSSATAMQEDRFRASIDRPVRVGADGVVPAGTELRGIIRRSQPAERPQRSGRLELDFDALYVEGTRVDVRTSVVALEDEEASGNAKRKAGIGAVLGGVVGGLLKGRTGAIVGALIGGGAIVAQRGQDVELPEGTILTVRLERPVTVPR
jgi:hypothetical protein